MDITYFGHSCFKIKIPQTALVVDPFDPGMVGLKLSAIEADVVLSTHDHADHNNFSIVKGYRKLIDGPGEYEVGGISILGYPSFHDDKKGEKRGKNTLYVIEAQDIRMLHLGDLGHKLSDKLLEDIGEINILMIPVGGEYTIGSRLAAEVVREIEPNITIPMHYQTPGLNAQSFSKLEPVDNFLKEVGLPVEKMQKLSLKLYDLTEDQRVVILEKR
jgi:L-ascorbate metabolism protein UlaG (beta-lactamase superfamily)